MFDALRAAGIGVNVHYIPVHLQPYYRRLGFARGDFPERRALLRRRDQLPMYSGLTDAQQDQVVAALRQALPVKVAVIPARGGSKRIPRKNIRPFAGKPIIAYSIEAAHAQRLFDRIIVSHRRRRDRRGRAQPWAPKCRSCGRPNCREISQPRTT